MICAFLTVALWITVAANEVTDEEYMNTCEIAVRNGYPCVTYHVITDDGYILQVNRIPYGRSPNGSNELADKPIVFLQHGLLATSDDWVINLPHQSLGYLLADANYDVWMGNVRGNKYSRDHVSGITPKDKAFWKFSFDEMGLHDLPAMVELALNTRGHSKLYYVGFSQGTSMGFIKFCTDPQWTKDHIYQYHALAPIVYMPNTRSPFKKVAPYIHFIGWLMHFMGVNEFLPSTGFLEFLGGALCRGSTSFVCKNILFVVAGYDEQHINQTRLPLYLTHTPAGTSTQDMIHFAQLMTSNNFESQDKSTVYDVSRVPIPTYIYHGDKDVFSDTKDVDRLDGVLTHLAESYRYGDMDHLDFVWGTNAPIEVYPTLMNNIKNAPH